MKQPHVFVDHRRAEHRAVHTRHDSEAMDLDFEPSGEALQLNSTKLVKFS